MNCIGKLLCNTTYKGKTYHFTVHVVSGQISSLLSRSVSYQMGLVKLLEEVKQLSGGVGLLKGDPVKITLKDGVQPFCLCTARRVPISLLPKVTAELQRMEKAGIIERITKPTEWCAPMVPVMKKSGQVLICVDLKRLNQAVKRERFILPTLEDVTSSLAGSKVFSLLDAASGFWQVLLAPDCAELTTFITPIGRFY